MTAMASHPLTYATDNTDVSYSPEEMQQIAQTGSRSQTSSKASLSPSQDKFRYGIAGQFLNCLTKLSTISIVSRHSAYSRTVRIQLCRDEQSLEMQPPMPHDQPGTVSDVEVSKFAMGIILNN